jgi:Acetoacetate decarboxylase (ADC)
MPFFRPRRISRESGRHSLVDTIPFTMPVQANTAAAMVAAFPIDADKAAALLQGNQVHPLRIWKHGLLILTIVDYRDTNIGKYIEYSIGIGCTYGRRPAPPLVPLLLTSLYGTGGWVIDMPVSTLISVKGGRGIWGMPKHQANLNFVEGSEVISSQYDVDGQLAIYLEMKRPKSVWLPISIGATGYSSFRGMMTRSTIYFKGKAGFWLLKKDSARLVVGSSPYVQALKTIGIESEPIVAMYFPQVVGVLDDYFETWFLTFEKNPESAPPGLETVVNLPLSEEWLPPPNAPVPKS